MLTEDEAKTKVCCGPPQTINGREPLLLCLGSACMAWRWDLLPKGQDSNGAQIWVGSCGLAGPEGDRRGWRQ